MRKSYFTAIHLLQKGMGIRKMKYGLMPQAMWLCFRKSFARELYRMSKDDPMEVMAKAQKRYRKIIVPIPEIEKGDPFLVNILSAAMLAAVYLELSEEPHLDQVTDFYHHAMTNNIVMKCYLKRTNHYTKRAQSKLAQQAKESARRVKGNPYTWRFRFEAGPDINSYSAIFTSCGIMNLLLSLDISDICPAMCTYDYDMAKLGGSEFTRQHTLAGEDLCCDCHWRKQPKESAHYKG